MCHFFYIVITSKIYAALVAFSFHFLVICIGEAMKDIGRTFAERESWKITPLLISNTYVHRHHISRLFPNIGHIYLNSRLRASSKTLERNLLSDILGYTIYKPAIEVCSNKTCCLLFAVCCLAWKREFTITPCWKQYLINHIFCFIWILLSSAAFSTDSIKICWVPDFGGREGLKNFSKRIVFENRS